MAADGFMEKGNTCYQESMGYMKEGNFDAAQRSLMEAISCFEKSFDDGNTYAGRNLLQLYAMHPAVKNGKSFGEWLVKLADKKDGWGMMLLGTILCGAKHRLWMASFESGELPMFGTDLEEGLKLIAGGVDALSNDTNKMLDFHDCSAISEAYQLSVYNQISKNGRPSKNDINGFIQYSEKELSLMPPGNPNEAGYREMINNEINKMKKMLE
jgi:hypothetical protein